MTDRTVPNHQVQTDGVELESLRVGNSDMGVPLAGLANVRGDELMATCQLISVAQILSKEGRTVSLVSRGNCLVVILHRP